MYIRWPHYNIRPASVVGRVVTACSPLPWGCPHKIEPSSYLESFSFSVAKVINLFDNVIQIKKELTRFNLISTLLTFCNTKSREIELD